MSWLMPGGKSTFNCLSCWRVLLLQALSKERALYPPSTTSGVLRSQCRGLHVQGPPERFFFKMIGLLGGRQKPPENAIHLKRHRTDCSKNQNLHFRVCCAFGCVLGLSQRGTKRTRKRKTPENADSRNGQCSAFSGAFCSLLTYCILHPASTLQYGGWLLISCNSSTAKVREVKGAEQV